MRVIVAFVFTLTASAVFCQVDPLTKKEVLEIYQEIIDTDGSNLKNQEVREAIFVKNFETILSIIERQGSPYFPESKENRKLNGRVYIGTNITFTHILQTKPQLILNDSIISLISIEVKEGRIDSYNLKGALSLFQFDSDRDQTWTDELRKYFYLALEKWDVKLYGEQKK